MKPEEVLQFVKDNDIKIVDLKFNDLPGLWQHFSIPATELTDIDDPTRGIWVDGIGFDGSSIRGFKKIQESDMILVPDPATAVIDPICQIPTLSILCDVYDPLTKQPYTRDPRYIARKAEQYLRSTGIADTSYWGPEMEFFIFDNVRFEQNQRSGFYYIDSNEADWNTGREENPNLGYKVRFKEGYFPVPPHDSLQDIRSKIVLTMIETGIPIEVHHHAAPGPGEGRIVGQGRSLIGGHHVGQVLQGAAAIDHRPPVHGRGSAPWIHVRGHPHQYLGAVGRQLAQRLREQPVVADGGADAADGGIGNREELLAIPL